MISIFLVLSFCLVAVAVIAARPYGRRFAADVAVMMFTILIIAWVAVWGNLFLALVAFAAFLTMCFGPLIYLYRVSRRPRLKRGN